MGENPTFVDNDWFSLGFSDEQGGGGPPSGNNPFSVMALWMLQRGDRNAPSPSGVDVQTFYGVGTTNASGFDLQNTGFVDLKIVLDTQAAAWTATWYVNDSIVRGPTAFGSNPTIKYVGFGQIDEQTGSVRNFLLTRD